MFDQIGSRLGIFSKAQSWVRKYWPTLLVVVSLIIFWDFIARFDGRPNLYFPGPEFTFQQTLEYYDVLLGQLQTTFMEILLGFFFSTILAIFLAVTLHEFYSARFMSLPTIFFFHSIPYALLAPLFLAIFGVNAVTIALFISWGGFFPIFISTLTGLSQIRPEFNEFADLTDATRWQRIRYLKFPSALPYIFSGMKISATVVISLAIVIELIAQGNGIGYMLIFASKEALTGLLFGTVIGVSIIGVIWFYSVAITLDYLTPP